MIANGDLTSKPSSHIPESNISTLHSTWQTMCEIFVVALTASTMVFSFES